jgi:hypothetical protein
MNIKNANETGLKVLATNFFNFQTFVNERNVDNREKEKEEYKKKVNKLPENVQEYIERIMQ